MGLRKQNRPVAKQRLRQTQLGDDAGRAHSAVSAAVASVEKQVSELQGLTSSPPTITGSKGGNAALASLITALAGLGLVKDGTT